MEVMEEGEGADDDDEEVNGCRQDRGFIAVIQCQKGKRELTMIVSSANGATQEES